LLSIGIGIIDKCLHLCIPCHLRFIHNQVTCSFLPVDNNLAERSIRPVAIGRKNCLFLGSGEDGGGDWAAIAYSLIGSCALNHLDPYRYLADIAPRLTDWRVKDHASLTPRAWAKRNRTAVA